MSKLTLSNVSNISGAETSAITTINSNSASIETALENTLSRDGTSPNSMNADIDMNNYDVLNVGVLDAVGLTIAGEPFSSDSLLAKGDAATITVGTVTTLSPGSSATVVNAGTTAAAVLNFGIPRGTAGAGTGDMLYSDNLSGLTNTATARTNIGLGSVTNTSDANKPVSTAQAAADLVAQSQEVGYNPQTGASYTVVLTDAGKFVSMNNASANSLIVPPNSTTAFPILSRIDIGSKGAGQTTVTAGVGVTIRSAGTKLKLTSQYSGGSLLKIDTDEWWLFGDLSA